MKKRMKIKQGLVLVLILAVAVMPLTGCSKKEHSAYSDATVDIPDTYASYSFDPVSFRFEAGWYSAEYDTVQQQMDLLTEELGISSNIAIFMRLQSPPYDQGTVNYMDFGYFQVGSSTKMADLEEVMTMMDQLSSTVKKLDMGCSEVSSAKIRCYGDDELEALTCCYKLTTEVSNYTITCVEQIALIPHGNTMYTIVYSDFTNTEDTSALEEVLSTLSFTK